MTKNQERTLYSCRSDKLITLAEAVQSCSQFLQGAIALLYAPQRCKVAKFTENQFQDSDGNSIAPKFLANVFEARIFNQNCELRWLNRLNGEGDAVLLSESEQSIDEFSSHESNFCESLEQQYLLWGEAAKSSPKPHDWQRLASARVGKLDVPIDQTLEGEKRVYLSSLEYLAEIDQFGNFAVIEERLVSLEVKS